MSEPNTSCDENEVIHGPLGGYYVATYACPTDVEREEYAPCYKLFSSPPESYFEEFGCVAKGRPPTLTNDVVRALFLALVHAQEHISRLPSSEEPRQSRIGSLANNVRQH